MMEKLNLTPLSDRRREHGHRIIMMYRIVNGLVAIPLENYTDRNSTKTRHHQQTLKTIRSDCDIYKNSFFPRTIKDWNSISLSCVSINKIEAFKNSISAKKY